MKHLDLPRKTIHSDGESDEGSAPEDVSIEDQETPDVVPGISRTPGATPGPTPGWPGATPTHGVRESHQEGADWWARFALLKDST
jgi:hypothetical protein